MKQAIRRYLAPTTRGILMAGALLSLVGAGQLGAQVRTESQEYIIKNFDGTPGLDIREAKRGFNLFASGDGAHVGMRMPGNYGLMLNNYGVCGEFLTVSCQNNRIFNVNEATTVGNGSTAPWFVYSYIAGTPPSEWLKIREVWPGANSVLGGGYNALANEELIARQVRWGPADGSLGNLFTGETSTNDGSCLDNTGNNNGNTFFGTVTGVPVLPSSNCEPTWGGGVWPGDRPIPGEGWEAYLAQDPANFTFDFWRVPEEFKDPNAQFLGSNFATVGEISDYPSDFLDDFGEVTPFGSGPPQAQGYPLGLKLRYEAFNFGLPTLADVAFIRVLIINRSEDVYGTGIDYDSLYFGVAPGGLMDTQGTAHYWVPELGLNLVHNSNQQGANGPCADPARSPTGVGGCTGNNDLRRGFDGGTHYSIILKSPIGDLRNKLFTRNPDGSACAVGVDPFCNPAHPNAGDTITFNHGQFGGFGGADTDTWGRSQRAAFGHISGTEVNTLDGRGTADLASPWQTFRNFGYPSVQGVYNKYVPPGGWDYNKDGVLDTITVASCHTQGCVTPSWDTLPGGQLNVFSNVGGTYNVGPFALAAGDTTVWFMAYGGSPDSASAWTTIQQATDLYLNFFLAPGAPPPVNISQTQVTPASVPGTPAQNQGAQVNLFFSDDPETWVDPFLENAANSLTPNLIAANPNLQAEILARAADNLEAIEIYRSCDGGNTFDATGNCQQDPAVDEQGNSVGVGWQAYTILDVDANSGDVPNRFIDNNVVAGRTYLYVILGKSRGGSFKILDPNTLRPDSLDLAPSLRNAFSRSTSDPNVVSVFVPASNQAGFVGADTVFTERGQGATTPFTLTFLTGDIPQADYVSQFGNRVVIERDSSIADEVAVETRVRVERVVTADINGVATDSVVARTTFTRTDSEIVPVAGQGVTSAPVVNGDIVTTTTTFVGGTASAAAPNDPVGYVLASGGTPIYGAFTLTTAASTPNDAFLLADFPGFTVNADNSNAGNFNNASERQLRGPATRERLGLTDADTLVQRGVVNNFMVQWMENNSSAVLPAGNYRVDWVDDAFGLVNDGIVLNLSNPAATGQEVRNLLASRAVGTTGATDLASAEAIVDGLGLLIPPDIVQGDLEPVNFPFTITNISDNRPVTLATFKRGEGLFPQRPGSIVLGNFEDTVRVNLPDDVWVPGDPFIMIEEVSLDSVTTVGAVLDGSGNVIQNTRPAVTFFPATLGCINPRLSCNPVRARTPGAGPGYLPMNNGDATEFGYFKGFGPTSRYAFSVVPPVEGEAITQLTDSALAEIRVVPNPFLVFSQFQSSAQTGQLMFTGLPPRGTLRIYTVAGAFVQQIDWTPDDLQGAGDLFYNLRTREGLELASGLYIYVVTAPQDPSNPNSEPLQSRGKFVVIRGDAQ